MNKRLLLPLLALAGFGGAAFLLFGEGGSVSPDAIGPNTRFETEDDFVSGTQSAEQELARRAAATSENSGERSGAPTAVVARLAVSGRVVDRSSAPVAGAEVALWFRADPRALFEEGERRGFGRGGFDGGDFEELRRMLEYTRADEVVRTAADGTFVVRATAFASSNVEVTVQHDGFAPRVVRSNWERDAGALVLGDIVLATGTTLHGRVLTETGNPVPGAVVHYAEAGGGRGGRGGPGRFDRSDRIAELVGTATADPTGQFVFDHVPAGEFQLRAEAPLHVPGESERIALEEGRANVDVGNIVLPLGQELRGTVVDPRGAPVADAEVTGTASRRGDEERGRGRGRGPGRARQSGRTDAEGRFHLDMLPRGAIRLEVRHPQFVDHDVDPHEPARQPEIEVRLDPRPYLAGVVVDADTGRPIVSYAIRQRPAGGMPFGRPMGGDEPRRARGNAEANPEAAAAFAEIEAQWQRERAWRVARLGGVGEVPRNAGTPEQHPGGRFRIDDLNPGAWLFELSAPGYVPVVHGPVEVAVGTSRDDLVFRLERGVEIDGRVVDAKTGAAVADAQVTLSLPRQEGTRDPGPLDFFRGNQARGTRLEETRTDRDGRFRLGPWRGGTYALSVEAEGYPGFVQEDFAIGSAAATDLRIALDPGARVYGIVHGLPDGQRASLTFTHAETGERRTTEVDPGTHEYAIEGLPSGGWFIGLEERGRGREGGRGDFRERIGTALAARTGAQPDLFVPAGGDLRHDIGATSVEFATVRGRVYRRGSTAEGLEVRLVPETQEVLEDPRAQRWLGGRIGRMLSDRVDAETGTFTIADVPPGDYVLEVARSGRDGGRGGRGGPRLVGPGATLHQEPLVVRKGVDVERTIEVVTASAVFELVGSDGQPLPRTRLVLVPAAAAGDLPPEQWRGLPGTSAAFADETGRVTVEDLAPGSYRFAVQGRGVHTVTGDVVLGSGTPARVRVAVERDPEAAQQAPRPASGERAGPTGERGGQPGAGGRRQGGGRRGGR